MSGIAGEGRVGAFYRTLRPAPTHRWHERSTPVSLQRRLDDRAVRAAAGARAVRAGARARVAERTSGLGDRCLARADVLLPTRLPPHPAVAQAGDGRGRPR